MQGVQEQVMPKALGQLPIAGVSAPAIEPLPAPTRPLRIAFCLPEREWLEQIVTGQWSDAARIQQGYIADGLCSRGHRLTLVAPADLQHMICTNDPTQLTYADQSWSATRGFDLLSRSAWRLQQLFGVRYLNIFANGRRFDAALHGLRSHDLVYERNGIYNVAVAMACRRLKLPYVLFFDADQIAEHDFMGKPIMGWQRRFAQLYLRYNLWTANAIICVAEPARRHLMHKWGASAEKLVVFPNGVDVQRFQPNPAVSVATRRTLGLGAAPLLIFVGNFYEWHDTTTLLNAFAQVLTAYPETRLLLVGDGPQRQAMMHYADQLDIGYAVHFTGLVAHTAVPHLLAAADIAVAPVPVMNHEMWLSPMKLFEYMATGLAIVATASGQLVDLVQSDRNGCLTPPGDATAMAVTIQRLLGDAALRTRLGRQAREDAVQRHSWAEHGARLERLFTTVIAGQPVN